jgi:hypothetical protein
MFQINWELERMLAPIVLGLWALIFFLWSRVEQPLRTVQLEIRDDIAFTKLKQLIHEKGFSKLGEDERSKRISIKGVLKVVDVILWRCWSNEVIFRLKSDNSHSKLTVSCKVSPFRATASRTNPNYLSYEMLDQFLNEFTRDVGGQIITKL